MTKARDIADLNVTILDSVESGATADQTNAEIRTAVEAATDSNVFTDADHTKLNAIEASADVTDTTNVQAAGALMDSELTSIASVKALNQGVATTDSPTFTTVSDASGNVRSGRKNLIINGGFDVWQRGTSFSPAGSPMYTADRWSFEGASLTISRSTDVPSGHLFKYSARIQNSSGSTSNNRTYLEDVNTILPNGVPWVLSAWIKVTSGGISIDLGDTAISGGLNSPSVWTKVSVSSSTRNTSGANAFLDILLDANTDAYITGIQLELGSVATDFEHRSYGEELALCQRYFEVLTDPKFRGLEAASRTAQRMGVAFKTTKRANPSVTLVGTLNVFNGNNVVSFTASNVVTTWVSIDTFEFDTDINHLANSVVGKACVAYSPASGLPAAFLHVDAEL